MAIPAEISNIPATRFKVFTEETNVGSFNFGDTSGSDILNTAKNALSETSTDAQEILAAAKESILDPLSEAKDSIEELMRDSKTQLSSMVNYAIAAPKNIMDWLGGAVGMSAGSTKSVSDLLTRCKAKGGGIGYGGRPYDKSMNCQGKTAKLGNSGGGSGCDSSSYSNIIDKLTGGNYKNGHKDIQSALNALMSLSGIGYGMGMCGVFGAMKDNNVFGSGMLGKNEYGKAAGGLMSVMNNTRNTSGWIDLAASSAGLSPQLSYPDTVRDFYGNYSVPSAFKESDFSTLADMTLEATSDTTGGWYAGSSTGNFMTISDMEGITPSAQDVLSCKLTDRAFGEADLDVIPDDDLDFALAAGIAI